ncbi:hypothetical protein [Wansuia hejianensis]|uniref:Uncharacterized protein n=1 Tax=Wansuia hejianensis TaxID=2763667 RepID=A0A926IMV2_9FIRM|nr:hypothetical protein [Wansuia hejianensis]MBC8590038.1 hypothetical protein [Wansuia hejianensis]
MASKDQLRKIAIYCDKYKCKIHDEEVSLKNISDVEYESCTNCVHFTKEHTCDLDLIDKILSSLAMELDLKS